MASSSPEVQQIFATSEFGDEGHMVTVVALLKSGDIVYTGLAGNPEWHYLPPIPPREDTE